MVLISHVVVGSVIAEKLSFLPALAISFLSHFALDYIPHSQAPTDEGYKPNKKTYFFVIIDLLLIGLYLFWLHNIQLINFKFLLIIFASVSPDLFDITRYNKFFYKTFKPFYDFHDKIQRETLKPIGYITQLLLITISIILIGK